MKCGKCNTEMWWDEELSAHYCIYCDGARGRDTPPLTPSLPYGIVSTELSGEGDRELGSASVGGCNR